MTIYTKKSGVWTRVKDVYVKDSGTWTAVEEGWLKQGGVSGSWVQVHTPPDLPPSGPVLSLQEKKTISGIAPSKRYIEVGVRYPGTTNLERLRRIRVLVSSTSQPSTQFGSGYVSTPALPPNKGEPWSDFYFQSYTDENGVTWPESHDPTTTFVYKEYNPNYDPSLAGNKTYYFSAWCQTDDDQWSVGTFDSLFVPSTAPVSAPIYKKAVINPNACRSMYKNTSIDAWEWVDTEEQEYMDDLYTTVNRGGIVFYGNKVTSIIPSGADITKARVRVSRKNDEFQATANVYARWHNETDTDALADDIVTASSEIASLGTINKGETKWFNLPSAWHDNLAGGFRGLVITRNTTGGSASHDHWLYGVENSTRAFELELEWTET